MEAVLKEKKSLKSNITKAFNELNNKSDLDKIELELYEKKSSAFEKECADMFKKIFELCDSKDVDKYIDEQQSVQESIDKIYLMAKRKLLELAPTLTKNEGNISESIRLPKLNLPTFSGQLHEWLSFRDIFISSIHNNSSLSASQKLSYLKLSLHADPLRIIQSIPITDANYAIAWNLLEDRFSNKRDQVFAHLKRFMSFPSIQIENPSAILKLVDNVTECIRSLEVLEQKVEGFSETILAFVLIQKLDSSCKLWWERESSKTDELPKISQLISFLKNHARTLQASKQTINTVNQKKIYQQKEKTTSFYASAKNPTCICCKGENLHSLFRCNAFQKMPINERIEFVKGNKICFNCLSTKSKHSARNCTSNYSCNYCSKKHSYLLHLQKEKNNNPPQAELSQQGGGTEIIESTSFHPRDEKHLLNPEAKCFENRSSDFAGASVHNSCQKRKTTILSTALINIESASGEFMLARALIDVGSNHSYISDDFAKLLGIRKEKINVSVACLNDAQINIKWKITTTVSNKSDYQRNLDFLIVPRINNFIPGHYFRFPFSELPKNVKLADPRFNEPSKIDVLLGTECFYELLKTDQIRLKNSNVILQHTVFGYVVGGSISDSNPDNHGMYCGLICNVEEELKKFFDLESIGIRDDPYCNDEDKAMEKFTETVSFNNNRYEVALPWKKDWENLSDNYKVSEKGFKYLINKMRNDDNLGIQYKTILKEYLDCDIIEKVLDSTNPKDRPLFYLPHRAVFRNDSVTTKTRIVFDASSHDVGQLSLNDCLWTGINLNPSIFQLLINFRLNKIGILADVEKAFLQITLSEKDRDAVRFLFVEVDENQTNKLSDNSKIIIYCFKRLLFGLNVSPFLLAVTVKEH